MLLARCFPRTPYLDRLCVTENAPTECMDFLALFPLGKPLLITLSFFGDSTSGPAEQFTHPDSTVCIDNSPHLVTMGVHRSNPPDLQAGCP